MQSPELFRLQSATVFDVSILGRLRGMKCFSLSLFRVFRALRVPQP